MKTHMTLFFLVAVVALLIRAQTTAEPNYDNVISNLIVKLPLDNYRPLLNELKVETLYPEDVDLSAVSVKSLNFPALETECNPFFGSPQEQSEPCPLKENGKLMFCNMKITHSIQEVSDITAFEMRCDLAAGEASLEKVRTRRSKSGKGGSKGGRKGGRGRPGGGSSIAGNSNRGNSGTRTA